MTVEEMIGVLEASDRGLPIQYRSKRLAALELAEGIKPEWIDYPYGTDGFNFTANDYRVKPILEPGTSKIKEISQLKRGNIIRHVRGDGKTYMIDDVHGNRATAVRTIDVTNPTEWEIVL